MTIIRLITVGLSQVFFSQNVGLRSSFSSGGIISRVDLFFASDFMAILVFNTLSILSIEGFVI